LLNPFPPTSQALDEPNGLLAVGGDLEANTLLCAYAQGIFPWFETDQEILWWSPDPRLTLKSDEIHVSRSLRKAIRQCGWRLQYDTAFADVMSHCAQADRNQPESGTWITPDMRAAYCTLHGLGVAHSVEVYDDDTLIGGLYGILLGNMFFGESMFSLKSNASKMAFVGLSKLCRDHGIGVIDCQVHNEHLVSLGAQSMARKDFENHLRGAIKNPMTDVFANPLCLLPKEPLPLEQRLGTQLVATVAELL
jgi:leucyl/phenylalanyl-tRNA--protein transferase